MNKLICICLIAFIACAPRTREEDFDREFMVQFIDTWISGDTLFYGEPHHAFLEKQIKDRLQKGVIEEYKSVQSMLKGEAPVDHISLKSDEIKKISERANFENIEYWKKNLFEDSLRLASKKRIVTIRQIPRGWTFTKPTFIKDNEYCFFGFDKEGSGGYFVYKKDEAGEWRKAIKVTSWTVDFR